MELNTLTLNGKTYDSFASNVLIVTEEDDVASHSASEIQAAVEAGKTVFFSLDGCPMPLSTCDSNRARFADALNGPDTGLVGEMSASVDNEKHITYEVEHIAVYSKTQIDSKLEGFVGGYYTPKVEQTDANTMKVSYTASKEGMAAVADQNITLPAGPKGDKYELTEADKQEIAAQAAEMVEVPEGGTVTPEQIEQAVDKYLEAHPVSGLSSTEKNLILTLFRNAEYTSANMEPTLGQLEELWSGEVPDEPDEPDVPDVPEKTLTSISAIYSGGNVPAGTAVTALTGIVVTANYSDGSTATVTGYTLSGTISEGSNTVTVSYGGKTTTFIVMGIAEEDIDYHVMTIEDASQTTTAQNKTIIRGYDNSEYSNVLVPNVLNELPVWIVTSYPGTNNFNVSDNIENLAFEENSTVTGSLEIKGNSLKTIKNFPVSMTGLSTGHSQPYAQNLEYVGGLENNTALTSLNLSYSALKHLPVLNPNAPITSLTSAFLYCTGMDYDISGWRVPDKVTSIKQLFRHCNGIRGNFLVDRNYTSTDCLMALSGTSVNEVTITNRDFAAPFSLLEEKLSGYTPLTSDGINATKQWKLNVYRDSEAYKLIREAYAGIDNGILKYDVSYIDGDAPTKNISFYGDSQLSPFGKVTSQMLPGMSDDVFLWNLAVRGASTASYKPMFAKFPERRSDVTVLWLITNDTGIGANETMNNIRHYVDSLETDKYIILGTWFFHYEELKSRNEQLRATYGDRYFDVHQYTLDNWERITGITPTEADLTAVANDTVPPSLIDSDGVHENDAGGLVIATGIKEKLMGLGYIDSTWLTP